MRLLTAGSLVRVQLEEPLYRGIAQLVEHRSPKPSAVGSIPTAPANAAIAQSVECILGKDEVTSSNLVISSKGNAPLDSNKLMKLEDRVGLFYVPKTLQPSGSVQKSLAVLPEIEKAAVCSCANPRDSGCSGCPPRAAR